MSYVWQRWLADEFRAAGLEVIEVEGWENRGRPASTGNFDPQGPVTTHHTGATSSASNPGPTLGTLIQGRSDLPGPLCQWSVRHDGKVVVIAAGRANHAGAVGKAGVTGMPLGADGNALALGDEVDTNGTQDLPQVQRDAIALTNAVALKHYARGADYAHRHADISGSGKWDIGSLTTQQLRGDALAALNNLEDDMQDKDFDRIKTIVTAAVTDAVEPVASDLETLRQRFETVRKNTLERDRELVRRARETSESVEDLLAKVDRKP